MMGYLQLWITLLLVAGHSCAANQTSLFPDGIFHQLSGVSSNFIPTATATGISQTCVDDSQEYLRALRNDSPWALSMFHASGRLPDQFLGRGFHDGNVLYDPGLYDQCLSIVAPSSQSLKGQYCTVYLSVLDPTSKVSKAAIANRQLDPFIPAIPDLDRTIGFCLPSFCSAEDLRLAVAQALSKNKQSVMVRSHDRDCYTEDKIRSQSAVMDGPAVLLQVVLILIVLLVTLATLFEALWSSPKESASLPVRVLHCFSAIRNTKELLSTSKPSADDISCLHGMRVLSFVGIILVHTGEEIYRRKIYNKTMMSQTISALYWQPVANFTVLVDTFLLLGGLLVCSSALRDLDRGRFNLRRFYFHRYLRLTPVYAFTLLVVAALVGWMGSGPDWAPLQYRSEDCRSYWWSHLLYLNNHIPKPPTYCLPETWYLATEMQMFIFSPLFFYPLWRWRKAGLVWSVFALSACLGYNVAIHILWDLPPTIMGSRPSMMSKISEYFRSYYFQPIPRFAPYLLGIILGWILHRTKHTPIKLGRATLIVGWIASIVIPISILYALSPFLNEEEVPAINPLFRVAYGSFNRVVWATVIGWIIFVCVQGYGGKVNDLLSCKVFLPLARLTYVGYLIHYTFISAYVSQSRMPYYFTSLNLLVSGFGVLVVAFVLSSIIAVAVEMPFRNLEKFILPSTAPAIKLKR